MITVLVVLRPAAIWWAIALMCSAILLALELVNSAIERLLDHLDGRQHPEIGVIKDMAGAAVVVASAGVLVVGLIMIAETLGWL